MPAQFLVFGANHKTLPIEAREQLSVTVSKLVENFQEIGHQELERLVSRCPEFSEKQIEEIEHATKRIIDKVLRKPLAQLKNPELKDRREELLELLKTLFVDNKEQQES